MRFLALFVLLGLLSGCATTVSRLPAADNQLAWQQHQTRLAGLTQWRLRGRIGIQTEDDSLNASLDWSQQQEHYDIHLFGPMGSGSLRLSGDNKQVELITSKGEQLTAADPEWLIYQQMGLRLPVAALRYWVLGLPAPGQVDGQSLDIYGRLARLEQQGWEIHFHRYSQYDDLELPAKVFMNNHRAKVRLVIKRWELQQAETATPSAQVLPEQAAPTGQGSAQALPGRVPPGQGTVPIPANMIPYPAVEH